MRDCRWRAQKTTRAQPATTRTGDTWRFAIRGGWGKGRGRGGRENDKSAAVQDLSHR